MFTACVLLAFDNIFNSCFNWQILVTNVGLPSGGDWALQHTGAITLRGSEFVSVSSCNFERLDGIGVHVSGYNRNTSITDSTFSWLGSSAIALWGETSTALNANGSKVLPEGMRMGPDAREGLQPHHTLIAGNLVREYGLWEKQSSAVFQALSQHTTVQGNVFLNAPRAHINLNDGMGGGDQIVGNLLLNAVRESGDHGPINSWDRQPYITTSRHGSPSVLPLNRTIAYNFILGTYNSQETVDNDDGSSYYDTHHNVLAFADNGLKSNFGGHNNVHRENLYLMVGSCFYGNPCHSCATPSSYARASFVSNRCVFRNADDLGGYLSDCGKYTQVHLSQWE